MATLPSSCAGRLRKRAVEGADRRARRADDDDVVLHVKSPLSGRLRGRGVRRPVKAHPECPSDWLSITPVAAATMRGTMPAKRCSAA